MRSHTTPPDLIRYGRSPAAPAPPAPVLPRVAHRPAAAAAAAVAPASCPSRGQRLRNGAHRYGSAAAAAARSENTLTTSNSGSNGRIQVRRRSGNGEEEEGQETADIVVGCDGLYHDASSWCCCHYCCRCECPPLAWNELEPWEQRNPRPPWMMKLSPGEGRGGGGRERKTLNREAVRKGNISDDEVKNATRTHKGKRGWWDGNPPLFMATTVQQKPPLIQRSCSYFQAFAYSRRLSKQAESEPIVS